MPFTKLGATKARQAEPEYTNEAPAGPVLDDELSDVDLEEVLGGLERIHFPDPIDLTESEI
ncbi:MAG: hypothetical protein ACREMA_05100 [Longimicrobiales bacterium]